MFRTLRQYLRSTGQRGFIQNTVRLALTAALVLMLASAAAAYTIVLRSGRRIEIPSQFTVTKLTLTYEAAPGINVTLQMATIDVAATERANGETAGALLRRAEQPLTVGTASSRARPARRELTRQDIENARRAREKSEQEYERRRQELGLPSLEEIRRRNLEETKQLEEAARQLRAGEAESEAYWRMRASNLRAEIAALDAQINYVRARLLETPDTLSLSSYSFITGISPFYPRGGHTVTRFPVVTGHPGFMRGPHQTPTQGAGFLAFGGAITPGRVRLNLGFSSGRFGRRGIFGPPAILYGVPYANYDYSGERASLISRLHELEAARAGLQARWRSLEDEARRAGAQPGWLRD